MKVLHVIPSVGPVRGGTSVAALELVQALRSQSIDAEIATTNDNGSQSLDVPLHKLVDYRGTPVRFFNKHLSKVNAISEFIFSWDFTRWIWKNIDGYDLIEVHSFFSYVCTITAVVARFKNKPYVINPHGHFLPWVINQKALKKRIYMMLVEGKNLNKANAIHCSTQQEALDVRHNGIRASPFVVPYGVDLSPEMADPKQVLKDRYGVATSTPVILFLSRLHPKKRLDFLLDVLEKLKGQASFHLMIGGSGDEEYEAVLNAQVSQLGLSDHVTFAGFVGGVTKDLLLQSADIFALPTYGENFGISTVEAMAAKVAVITTPALQLAPDIEAAGAGIIVPGEQQPWVNALGELLRSPEQRQIMGQRGAQLARSQYDWDVVGRQLAEVYRSVLDGKVRGVKSQVS
ncbi:MAG: glycosyltransferase [Cyanobacteria bacterium P01_D01_bin.73]